MTTHSNLECFLNRTTPSVGSQFLCKTSIQNLNAVWQPLNKDRIEYFNLGDLWECYDEWSAYGVGAPVTYRGQTVVQYYTPYLSAIQIFTSSSKAAGSLSDTSGDSEGELEYKSWSSDSSDVGLGLGGGKLSRSSSSNSDRMWDMDDLGVGLDGCCWPAKNRFGELYLEHFEGDGPFGRVPLKDKIDELAEKYPGLKTFNSVDLSPASWMAVAWYPIYHIPAGRNSKEIYASFLTYHTLSSSFQDDFTEGLYGCCDQKESKKKGNQGAGSSGVISLPPFGLATYRMQPRVWLNPETSDQELLSSLSSAADSWLKQLQVYHHDFNFFVSHPM